MHKIKWRGWKKVWFTYCSISIAICRWKFHAFSHFKWLKLNAVKHLKGRYRHRNIHFNTQMQMLAKNSLNTYLKNCIFKIKSQIISVAISIFLPIWFSALVCWIFFFTFQNRCYQIRPFQTVTVNFSWRWFSCYCSCNKFNLHTSLHFRFSVARRYCHFGYVCIA